MPSEKKQYGTMQEGPALPTGDFKGRSKKMYGGPQDIGSISVSPSSDSMKPSDHQKG